MDLSLVELGHMNKGRAVWREEQCGGEGRAVWRGSPGSSLQKLYCLHSSYYCIQQEMGTDMKKICSEDLEFSNLRNGRVLILWRH